MWRRECGSRASGVFRCLTTSTTNFMVLLYPNIHSSSSLQPSRILIFFLLTRARVSFHSFSGGPFHFPVPLVDVIFFFSSFLLTFLFFSLVRSSFHGSIIWASVRRRSVISRIIWTRDTIEQYYF